MSHSAVQRVEALLRSLVGITAAEVRLSAGGRIEGVRVATACALSNGQIVQNVRSALYAGLGMTVDSTQIELVDAKLWVAAEPAPLEAVEASTADAQAAPASEPISEPRANGNGKPGAMANGNGHGANHYAGGNGNGAGNGSRPPLAAREAVLAAHEARAPEPAVTAGSAPGAAPAAAPVNTSTTQYQANAVSPAAVAVTHPASSSLRVESVEVLRQAGRMRCRVVLAAGQERYSAVADAAEASVPEIQLAGRVTCDALRAAQLTGAHFDGANLVFVAGRSHVVVALSEWKAGGQPLGFTGSAVVGESLEHAAAVAVLQALRGTH